MYVLMVVLLMIQPRAVAWSAEFATLEACEAAGKAARKAFTSSYDRLDYICVKK